MKRSVYVCIKNIIRHLSRRAMILGSRWAVTKIRVKRLVRRRVKWDTLGSALKARWECGGCHGEQMENPRKSWENPGRSWENCGKSWENEGKS